MTGLMKVIDMLGNTLAALEVELERLQQENKILRERLAAAEQANE